MSRHSFRGFLRFASLSVGMTLACSRQTPPVAPVHVSAPTEIVSTAELPTTRSVAGTVRAATVSPLAAKVMGNVVAVHVREGDRVHAGQLLVEIDDREARTQSDRARAGRDAVERAIDGASAGVAAAEANAALAATNLKRFAALRERGSISVAELDDARAKSAPRPPLARRRRASSPTTRECARRSTASSPRASSIPARRPRRACRC